MPFNTGNIFDEVSRLAQDDARLIETKEMFSFIDNAVRQLNHDDPLRIAIDIAGDATTDYALPVTFQKGFSRVKRVEMPAGENPPVLLKKDDDWFIYEDPTKASGLKQRLRFKLSTPGVLSTLLSNLDVDIIAFQSGNIIRYTFNGSPDLSSVSVGDALIVTTSTNTSNDGSFIVVTVNDSSDFVEVINLDRSDNTDDEATDSPSVGTLKDVQLIRVIITTPHTVTDISNTLSQDDFMAIIYKTLVFLFRSLAARFAQTTESTIGADAVDYGGRTQNYLFMSERYETQYKQIVGIGGKIAFAQAFAETDIVFSHGEDLLFHPKRSR